MTVSWSDFHVLHETVLCLYEFLWLQEFTLVFLIRGGISTNQPWLCQSGPLLSDKFGEKKSFTPLKAQGIVEKQENI